MKKTLEPKGLVVRNMSGGKHTFALTDAGRELAERIVEVRKIHTKSKTKKPFSFHFSSLGW